MPISTGGSDEDSQIAVGVVNESSLGDGCGRWHAGQPDIVALGRKNDQSFTVENLRW
jgi:hypothetical protein